MPLSCDARLTSTPSRPLRRMMAGLLIAATVAGCSDGGTADPNPTSSVGTTITTPSNDPPSTDPPSTNPTTTDPNGVSVPHFVDENGFDDHTVPSVATIDELMAMSKIGVGGQSSMKFTIPEFDRPPGAVDLARSHLMDGNFYSLHDEWYYFRLLNGQSIPGDAVTPVDGEQFATVEEIYRWAAAQPKSSLPINLSYSGERLYAEDFYDLALHGDPRTFGVGSIVRFPDPGVGQPDHWLIELEFSDVVTPEIVAQFFSRLAPILPAEISDQLEWVVRSPQHEAVADQMQSDGLAFHDRIVHFSDLVPAGTVGVYNEGAAAGRLLYVGEGGAALSDATSTDIVITEHVPDWLPQASAIITSDPQTPLAHVNLLARNRGIPNASQAGIHDDAGVRQAARVRAYAVVIARGSTIQIALISREQYQTWKTRQQPTAVSVAPVDITDMALMVNLTDLVDELSADGLTEQDVDTWRPIIGGKSSGFLTLLSTTGLTPPPDPLAITVRPYIEHLAPLRDVIGRAIADPSVIESARARWLVLEGDKDYADQFPSDADASFATDYLARHPAGNALGDVLAAGGVRALVTSTPVDPVNLAEIVAGLTATYGDYDVTAGLRFRSSSSVEDIEGFNGAGLYTSYTGYLHPELLEDQDDHNKTIERALLRAWSSYWSFEAFEERTSAKIDHLSGSMGLTVHARFDDDLEVDNGVVTFTYLPGGGVDDAVVEINVQQGSVAVTNPDNDDVELPEVIRVTRLAGTVTLERIAASTLVDAGQMVLDDDAVRELFAQTAAVAEVWRDRLNASLDESQRVQTVVLDYEFKTMAAGWPHLIDGSDPYPERLVLRQVRSLDPGTRELPQIAIDLPVPRDVLMRAASVELVSCDGSPASQVEILTDPLLAPDMGYAEAPFVFGPIDQERSTCTRRVLFSSPRQALVGLVRDGAAFVIVG